MKEKIVGIVAIVVIVAGLVIGTVYVASGDKWVDYWGEDAQDKTDTDGAWGTEVEIEYEDGTTETLNNIVAPLKITYGDKDVSKFIYKLSAKGDSDELAKCSLDLIGFWVDGIVTSDGITEWNAPVEYGIVGDLELDGAWYEVYRLEIEADALESNLGDGEYKLEFAPAGSIRYRGDASSNWIELTNIPSDCWLTFDKEGYWIEITLEGGFG